MNLSENKVLKALEILKPVGHKYWGDLDSLTDLVRAYLQSGSPEIFKQINAFVACSCNWHWSSLWQALPLHFERCDEIDRRFIQVVGSASSNLLSLWIKEMLQKEESDRPVFPGIIQFLKETTGLPPEDIEELAKASWPHGIGDNQQISSYVEWLLSFDDAKFMDVLDGFHECNVLYISLLKQIVRKDAIRLVPFVKWLPKVKVDYLHGYMPIVDELVAKVPETFLPIVRSHYLNAQVAASKFLWGRVLLAAGDAALVTELRAIALTAAGEEQSRNNAEIDWLIAFFGGEIVPDLIPLLDKRSHDFERQYMIGAAAERLGLLAESLIVAAAKKFSGGKGYMVALEILIKDYATKQHGLIAELISKGLKHENSNLVDYHLKLVRKFGCEVFQNELWGLLEHKSKGIRESTLPLLLSLKDAESGALSRLKAKKAVVRLAAVQMLVRLQTETAKTALKSVVENETDDTVRDEALRALGQTGEISWDQIQSWMKRAEPKLAKPVVEWFETKHQFVLKLKNGQELSGKRLRYLFYRQSRVKEIAPDVEASALYDLIEPESGADLAYLLVQGCVEAEDRWIFALAGRLGDGRTLRHLTKNIPDWLETSRSKFAEYAVQGIGLMKRDEALLTLDAYSIRYRSKYKNVGAAAAAAFALAAENFGISTDELGDRVVPWLGFEAGKPRIMESGSKKVELRISTKLQLELLDPAKNKPLKAPPAEFKAEISELKASLKEAVKSQLLRMENQMVRQRRWTSARFAELYLKHPLLLPFAQNLVWGCYSQKGDLIASFRALPDCTLTDVNDDAFTPPAEASVGVAHPLEMEKSQREAWAAHILDYGVTPPFEQMTRPVVLVGEEEKSAKISDRFKGTSLNGMTFKSRSEKRGWVRGSVADAGSILSYRKEFPGAGVEAFISLDGMYMGMGMEDSIQLETLCFVKAGTVKVGSYTYDDPVDANDARLLPFGEVPAIPFSEVMTDLEAISGKNKPVENEEE